MRFLWEQDIINSSGVFESGCIRCNAANGWWSNVAGVLVLSFLVFAYDARKHFKWNRWTRLWLLLFCYYMPACRSGNALNSINVVTLRRARLVPAWVTVFVRLNHLGTELSTQVD